MDIESIDAILQAVQYKEIAFYVGSAGEGDFYIEPYANVVDNQTGLRTFMSGRRWIVSETASPSEVVQTAFKAVMGWEEHEIRETFLYKGKSIFGPHQDIENLLAVTE